MIKFKAKSLKTGQWVEGDLAYAETLKTQRIPISKVKVYIVKHRCNGGMLYITDRVLVDESTIEQIEV